MKFIDITYSQQMSNFCIFRLVYQGYPIILNKGFSPPQNVRMTHTQAIFPRVKLFLADVNESGLEWVALLHERLK